MTVLEIKDMFDCRYLFEGKRIALLACKYLCWKKNTEKDSWLAASTPIEDKSIAWL